MSLQLKPTKMKDSLYLLIPRDIRKMYDITRETQFTLKPEAKGETVTLTYTKQQPRKKKGEKHLEEVA